MMFSTLARRVRHIATAFVLLLLTFAMSSPAIAEDRYIHPAEVKSAMYDMVKVIETVLSLDSKASDKVFYSDPEIWGEIKNKGAILKAAQDFRKFRDNGFAIRQPGLAPAPVHSIGSPAYLPNYPGIDVNYTLLLPFGLVRFGVTSERTNPAGWLTGVLPAPYDTLGWTAYTTAVQTAGQTLEIAQLACTVAGCDPTGIVCAGVCAGVSVLQAAYLVLVIPLKCANAWDAQIDSAEIQAAYQNARITLGDLSAHDDRVMGNLGALSSSLAAHNSSLATHNSALLSHDAWVRAKLGEMTGASTTLADALKAHDDWVRVNLAKTNADLKKLLYDMLAKLVANQNEIIKLLKTPEGRRPGWGTAGY